MPPASVRNLELIIHDLKHSNYFRAWLVTFLATFIVFWVGACLRIATARVGAIEAHPHPPGFGVYVNHVDNTSQVFATGYYASA